MERNEIHEKLQEVFRDVFDEDELEISDETTADDVEAWDSLTHVQLIVEVEKAFGVKFSTGEVIKMKNVGEFIDLIKGKLK